MAVKAFSYLRFSSAAQAAGDSLRRQLALAEAWAAKHPEIELDTTTRDLGVSAYKGEHRVKGALAAFLKRVEQGQIPPGSFLLIEAFDRLSRENETVAINLLTSITLAGIKVVTLRDGSTYDDKSDAMDLMRAILIMSNAHGENRQRGARLAESWADKKKTARETGKVLTRRGPAWTKFNEATERFDLVPQRADVVRRIFKECTEGLGSSAIARRLNEDPDVEPFVAGSKGFHAGYVLTILKSPSVIGTYTPTLWSKTAGERAVRQPDGDEITGYYPPVIDKELFERCQAILTVRNKHPTRGRRGKTFPNILLGLGKCEACGGTLVLGNHMNKERVRYLRCYNSSRGFRCPNKTRYSLPKVQCWLEFFLAKAKWQDVPYEAAHDLTPLIAQRDDLKNKIANLLDQLEISSSVGGRLREREAELAKVEKAISTAVAADLLARRLTHTEAADEALKWVRSFSTLEGDDLYRARSKAHALLVDVFDFVMPVAEGMFVGKGRQARWIGDNAMTDHFPLPDGPIPSGDVLAELRGAITISWGEVADQAEAATFKASLRGPK